MTVTTQASGTQVMREFVPKSPLVSHLGIELLGIDDGWAKLRLPFREEITTIGQIVHGGAIATLIDTAAMVASWAGAELPNTLRGSTVAISLSYLAPADGHSVIATADVIRRGRRLVNVRVDAHADNTHVATALVTYRLG